MSIVHLIDEDGDDNVLELAAPDDDTESNIDFGVDPFEILADREVRIGTALYWQTNRRPE